MNGQIKERIEGTKARQVNRNFSFLISCTQKKFLPCVNLQPYLTPAGRHTDACRHDAEEDFMTEADAGCTARLHGDANSIRERRKLGNSS